VLTVDLAAGHNRETTRRFRQLDNSDCMACHDNDRRGRDKYPTLANIDIEPDTTSPVRLDWNFVDQLKDVTRMKLVIKGVVTREDAALCLEHGVDGIVVSNHGGRAENSGRSTIESLPEVVAAVDGRIPVLIDSGFRRGTDIFKALALGADAVCIGRPYIWGLASFGQPGVEAILDILRRELELVMRQCGTAAVSEIDESFLV
jgi:isopentenyl diphosphate isomerase/L-lactate dehydrogenase-like FMN-dependent dehydrogenase